jgi:peptide/nickel transport system permease protein
MDWWHKLKDNPLARWGAVLLLIFYLSVMAADFVAPYSPYSSPTRSVSPPSHPNLLALAVGK